MTERHGGLGNFAEDREKVSNAGHRSDQHNGGNFKNDPQRTSEAGKESGQQSGDNKSGKSWFTVSY